MPDRFTLLETIELLGAANCAELASRLGESAGTIRVALHRACRGRYIVPVDAGRYALNQRGADRLGWLRAQGSETTHFDDAGGNAEIANVQDDAGEIEAADGCDDAGEVEGAADGYDDAAGAETANVQVEGDEPIFRCACQEWTGDFEPGERCERCGQVFEWVDAGEVKATDGYDDTGEAEGAADGWDDAAGAETANDQGEGDQPIFRCACEEWTGDFEPGERCEHCGQVFEWVDKV